MKWIHVADASRIAESLSRDSGGLKVLVLHKTPVMPPIRPVVVPGNESAKHEYESDFADLAWELGLRSVRHGHQ